MTCESVARVFGFLSRIFSRRSSSDGASFAPFGTCVRSFRDFEKSSRVRRSVERGRERGLNPMDG
eukprot:31486-Pelagococcus_subviridis.AAC.13